MMTVSVSLWSATSPLQHIYFENDTDDIFTVSLMQIAQASSTNIEL